MPRGKERPVLRWGVEWHSKNRLDGETRYIKWHNRAPLLFHTRREARAWAEAEYGYIKRRPDLRAEPHGWRMPQAVRVEVIVRRAKGRGDVTR